MCQQWKQVALTAEQEHNTQAQTKQRELEQLRGALRQAIQHTGY